ncbi:MAG: DUF2956 family protein [Pseudomonadales bacterium]|nr:DUF2956 family protein [Pseudomonadales bacterium]
MAKRSRQEKKSKIKDKAKLSTEEKAAALAIVKDVSKPAFTKQQRKDVQQAIEQGIERYKRQHKAKARDYDKALKNQRKQEQRQALVEDDVEEPTSSVFVQVLPWALLVLSWVGFAAFIVLG